MHSLAKMKNVTMIDSKPNLNGDGIKEEDFIWAKLLKHQQPFRAS